QEEDVVRDELEVTEASGLEHAGGRVEGALELRVRHLHCAVPDVVRVPQRSLLDGAVVDVRLDQAGYAQPGDDDLTLKAELFDGFGDTRGCDAGHRDDASGVRVAAQVVEGDLAGLGKVLVTGEHRGEVHLWV